MCACQCRHFQAGKFLGLVFIMFARSNSTIDPNVIHHAVKEMSAGYEVTLVQAFLDLLLSPMPF